MSASNTSRSALTIAALGVVYGDIGTSPLYAFRSVFDGAFAIPVSEQNILAALSMIFWSIMIIVAVKYVVVMLRFDHRGEGGVLALLSFALGVVRSRPRLKWLITVMGAFAASLFYGDAVITPAISVLSAVEGIGVASHALDHYTVPIALVILVGLFLVQRHGTGRVGVLFAPVMMLWFASLAIMGAASIAQTPEVLAALSPVHAVSFIIWHPGWAFAAAGAVFLCVTGAEALYADMGHFGAGPVRTAWFAIVFPALIVNYLGQGALLLRHPEAARNPFYLLAPESMLLPLIVLATCATIIASQATISGAFSVTQQASRLDFLPRLRVLHTSDTARGQIYIPLVNWMLMVGVVVLVLGFRSSEGLAGAYGIAVAGDLLISSVIMLIVLPLARQRVLRWLLPLFLVTATAEALYFSANASKFFNGGWFPITLAIAVFTVLSTWRRGIEILRARKTASPTSRVESGAIDLSGITKVPGSAIFFGANPKRCPSAFLHNLKHNRVVHELTAFVTVSFDDQPVVADDERVELSKNPNGIVEIILHYGFREEPDLVQALRLVARRGVHFNPEETSFFASKPTIVSVSRRGLFGWRRSLFGWMLRSNTSLARYLGLPPNRVVELGAQIGI